MATTEIKIMKPMIERVIVLRALSILAASPPEVIQSRPP